MCGFAGYYGKGTYDRKQVIQEMGEKIIHRGPDDEGYFIDDYCALAFRRLSIIDLEGGIQPMHSADGRYVLTFNGEIYNYQDLRDILEKEHGCVFQTESDTEAILQGYMVWGSEVVKKLRGMFAFVIYDKVNHSFYAARDSFGIKPFYYAKMNDTLMFGSEIKSFLAHPAFEKEINDDALKMYLIFQYSPMQETIFKNVYKLLPGHYMIYDGKELVVEKYFETVYQEEAMNEKEGALKIDETIRESVKYHQISDVEVGGFLSGGVDSSYITAVAKPDKTYSVGFESHGFDETEDAKRLCDILKIHNKCKHIEADDFFNALPEIQYYSDEPHANLSAVPLYFLSDMASQDVKVVLSGEGADEFFGGYEDYIPSGIGNLYKSLLPRGFRKNLGDWAKKRPAHKGLNFLKRNALNLEDEYIGHAFIMDNEEADQLLAGKHHSTMRYQDVTKPIYDQVKDEDEIHKKLYLDMHLWLPGDILLKADKMTMAHSLELRVPYLDRGVWDLARTIDSKNMIDGMTTKKMFREASDLTLPEEWAKRRKKGFPVPIIEWLRQDKYYNLVKERFMRDDVKEFFNQDLLIKWLDDHKSGQFNNQRKIYTVYAFLVWYDKYFGEEHCA